MKHHLTSIIVVAWLLGLGAGTIVNAQQANEAYGWQLMSEQEREEHRETMRKLKTAEEREQYRAEHHQKMQDRAKQQGVVLPDGPGAGPGIGSGMGPGHGKGR